MKDRESHVGFVSDACPFLAVGSSGVMGLNESEEPVTALRLSREYS